MNYELRRAERYVAVFVGFPFPFEAETAPVGEAQTFGYHLLETEKFLTSAQRWELPEEIERAYGVADHLLRALRADSYVGKSLENLGRSALAEDPDERYAHAWTAMELLARANYFDESPDAAPVGPDGQRTRLKSSVVVPRLIQRFHHGEPFPDTDWLEYLRNGSSHGGLSDFPDRSFAEFLERWEKAEPIRDLATEVLLNYLGANGLITPPKRPFRPRVMVGPGGVEPIDETHRLRERSGGR